MGWIRRDLECESCAAWLETRGDLSGCTVNLQSGEVVKIPREILLELVAWLKRDAIRSEAEALCEKSDEEVLGIKFR